jgi:hypothetical protein
VVEWPRRSRRNAPSHFRLANQRSRASWRNGPRGAFHQAIIRIDLSYPPHPGCETGRSCPYSPFKFRTNNTTRGLARYLTFVQYHRDRTVPDHTGPSLLLLVVHQLSHREGPKAPLLSSLSLVYVQILREQIFCAPLSLRKIYLYSAFPLTVRRICLYSAFPLTVRRICLYSAF